MRSTKRGTGIWRWLTGVAALGLYLALCSAAQASPQYNMDCTSCHTMPPRDSGTTKKVAATGAVPGNHQKHAGAQVSSCVVCHGATVTGYGNGHRNKVIELSDALGYSRKSAGFLNQTSVPPTPLGSCSTAACHSNGKGVLKGTPDWADPTPANCATCHDSQPVSGSHGKHVSAYLYGCVKCHSDHAAEALPFQHATSAGKRAIDVRFTAAPNTGGSFAAGQCSSTYCHSNGAGGAPNVAAAWGASALNCAGCHGSAASTGAAALSAKHASHVNNAAVLGTNYGCKECHANVVSNDTTISNSALHVSGAVNLAGPNVGTVANHTCSTSYCHSNGKGVNSTVTWTQSAPLSCNGCHGTSNALGAPDYLNGGAGAAAANSHGKHALAASDCVNCHSKTTTTGTTLVAGGQHIDGFLNFTAGNGKNFARGANKTCSNISCHSGNGIVQNVAAAQWGATLNCQGCHTTLSSAHTAHTGIYGCVSCHSDSVVDNATLKAGGPHMNNAINVAGAKITTFTLATQSCATACHGSTTPQWNNAASGACGTCHAVTAPLIASNAHAAHFSAAYGPKLAQDVTGCQVCHLYTGDKTATHVNGVTNLNAGFAVNGACSTCHSSGATQWGNAATVTCQSCHTGSGSTINGLAAPLKNVAASAGHGAFGQDCVACHDKTSAHIGVPGGTNRLIGNPTGTAACDTCHLSPAKVSPASLNMRAHQATGIGSLCSDCHDAHGTGNAMMVRTAINGTAVSYTGTSTFANGAQTGVCQVCHTNTKYFTKAGVPAQTHVDSTANCLDCHKHNPDSGLAFVPNGSCDSCHGYPPVPRKLMAGQTLTFGVQSNWSAARFEDYSGGGGAHLVAAHLAKTVRPSDGWAPCLACHNEGPALHQRVLPIRGHVENVSVKVDPQYRFSNDTFISYTGERLVSGGTNKSGSCFNVSCHFKPSPKWSIER